MSKKQSKKQLLLALRALSAVPFAMVAPNTSANEQTTVESAGVAGAVNPDATGLVPGESSRLLFVGSDIFRNETISTGPKGIAHLLFADKSSLTVSPNSEVVIDRFVYQPETKTGELTLSASRGVLRFVGGALSKTGDVTVKTPVGTLGIRGGVAVINIEAADGETFACLLYGDQLEGTHEVNNARKQIHQNEHCIRLTPDGEISDDGPIDVEVLEQLLVNFEGEEGEEVKWQGLQVPGNYQALLRELAVEVGQNTVTLDEDTGLEVSS